jgi:hypothetical protein
VQYNFGSGILYGVPTTGLLPVNPTPVKFGVLQNVSLEFAASVKELKGMFQFADDVAIADMKVTGKASFGAVSGLLYNNLFFGSNQQVSGTKQQAGPNGYGEPQIIPSATPFTVTVANSAKFIADYGVAYQSNGLQLVRVTANPTVGQYSVSAGVYSFAAADAGAEVLISYSFASTTGITTTIQNNIRGAAPSFELFLMNSYTFASGGCRLFACKASKLSMPTKLDDYQITDLEFQAFANPAGQVGEIYTLD